MKILGIGNAIVDVICKVEDSFLTNNGLLQAYLFGTKLKESYSDYEELLICSSLMVRSMLTCKLISR